MLNLLKEVLTEPIFPEQYLDVLWHRMVGGYEMDTDWTEDLAYKYFNEVLWDKNHPYGRPEFMVSDYDRKITRDDMLDFYNHYFGPKNMILSLVGGINAQKTMDFCEELFGSWDKSQEVPDEDKLFPYVTPWDTSVTSHIERKNNKDICMVIGNFGPASDDPNLMSAKIGNIILGQYDMMGRLGCVIREKHGLAYSVFSDLTNWKKGGDWTVSAWVDPKNLTKAGNLIFAELNRYITEPVSMQELKDAKSLYIGSFPLEFQNNTNTVSMIYRLAFFQKDLDTYINIPAEVNAVTPESILDSAQKWIDPHKVIVITSGPSPDGNGYGAWWM